MKISGTSNSLERFNFQPGLPGPIKKTKHRLSCGRRLLSFIMLGLRVRPNLTLQKPNLGKHNLTDSNLMESNLPDSFNLFIAESVD